MPVATPASMRESREAEEQVVCVRIVHNGGEQLLGYTDEEIIGQLFHRFYTPEDLAYGKPDDELHLARTYWGRSLDSSAFACAFPSI